MCRVALSIPSALLTMLLTFSPSASAQDAANEDAANEDAANEDAANEDAANEDAANERDASLLVMVTTDLKYGFIRAQGVVREDMVIGDQWETHELAQVGVGAFVGGMPFQEMPFHESKLTLGARLRVETIFAEDGMAPLLGGAALAGVTLGEPQARQFGFVMAGVGAVGVPSLIPAIFTAHLLGGTSVGGLVLAAGVDVGLVEEDYFCLFGVELGWGRFL